MATRKKILVTEPHVATCATDEFEAQVSAPTAVLVRNQYSHISAGTELACIAGLESFFSIPGTPGYTAVGEVVATGSAVDHLQPGDQVYTYGPHAEYFTIDITDRWHGVCVKLPEGINPEWAAFTHMATIAMTALRVSSIELGDYALVTGLGAIGNLAAQLAQLQGARVIAADIVDSRIEAARKCGIELAVNSARTNLKAFIEEKTEGQLASTYIDASGSAKVVEASVDCVAWNGETIILGSPRARHEADLAGFLRRHHLMPWNHSLKGALEFIYPTHPNDFNKHSIERNAKIALRLIKEGRLAVGPLYTHKASPEEIQSAYDGLRSKPEEYMGVIIDWA
ncbi:MAG: zinc-binding alcohol dehydrogenase [Phaeodactylibacter sp.]|nr:zinc-binding alcohol dehydrogenase [Phaeodactylibacter sp.]